MSLFTSDQLKKHVKTFEKNIQKWLEPSLEIKHPYQVNLEFENDPIHFETTDFQEFSILLFSRMSIYFEKGFLIEDIKNLNVQNWTCPLHFCDGNIFISDPPLEIDFPIPSPGAKKVLCSTPSNWTLHSQKWQILIPQSEKWTALIFQISPELRFLFCSQLAEPWLKIQTENALNFIERALAVQP
jgi:hypothetical protein